jgi:hypothetical protein
MIDTPSATELSQVIGHVIAPAFILGAVSGFISVLVTRLNRIIDRCRIVQTIQEHDPMQKLLLSDLPRLNRRAALINHALFFAVASALVTILLMIVAFVDAFFDLPHERGVAILFIIALLLLGFSLFNFAREIRIALNDLNNFD